MDAPDPGAGDGTALQVDDPPLDRRAVLGQADRQLARVGGLEEAPDPAGPEPRGRGDQPGELVVAVEQDRALRTDRGTRRSNRPSGPLVVPAGPTGSA